MIHNESALQFKFSTNWHVKKYDDHYFYRALSGAGLKGMDFIGIVDSQILVLIEVKNYKIRFPSQPPPIQEKILGTSPQLVDTMVYKVEDTFLAIRTIIKYYQRRWWYAPLVFLFQYLPTACLLRFEWGFWTYAQQLIATPTKTELVLWLELETSYPTATADEIEAARQRIQTLLKKKIPHYQVYVCHTESHPYQQAGLSVR